MNIKELIFDENDPDCGIQAISFVTHPAIEKDFMYFNNDNFVTRKKDGVVVKQTDTIKLLDPVFKTWKYWKMATRNNEVPTIETSHEFCKDYAYGSSFLKSGNKGIYTIPEINGWHLDPTAAYKEGWMTQTNFTLNFNGKADNYNLDQQIFNCRHFLTPVRDINELKKAGIKLSSDKVQTFSIDFAVSNADQHIIKGVVMIPNVLIYRRDQETGEEYHVYFSKETIKKLKDKYGFNRTITIQHEEDITGNAILLDSYIYPSDKDDNAGYTDLKEGSWICEYKILNEKLWDIIKTKGVKGFSVEALLPFN